MALYDYQGNVVSVTGSEATFQNVLYPDISVISAPNYPHHDATVIHGKIWAFNKPTDGVSKVYTLAGDTLTQYATKQISMYWKTGKELEFKSADYNNNIDALLVGNGQATYVPGESYLYVFYEVEDWLNTAGNITFNNCGTYTQIDVSDLGDKCYGFWAADNPDNNLVYVSINMFRDIYLIQLGEGANNLGSGTFSNDGNRFNGSYKVIKHWEQTVFVTGEYGNHGGQAYNGSLYLVNNNNTKNEIYRFILNADGSLQIKTVDCSCFMQDGNLQYRYMDGMFILDGYMYSAPLYINNSYHTGSNKVLLKIKVPE